MTAAVAALDARNTIPARLKRLDVSQGFFAEYCGYNKVEFSRLMNGVKPMSNDQIVNFDAALNDIEWMLKQFFPLRPRMNVGVDDARRVKNFIAAVREYRESMLSIQQIQAAWKSAA